MVFIALDTGKHRKFCWARETHCPQTERSASAVRQEQNVKGQSREMYDICLFQDRSTNICEAAEAAGGVPWDVAEGSWGACDVPEAERRIQTGRKRPFRLSEELQEYEEMCALCGAWRTSHL